MISNVPKYEEMMNVAVQAYFVAWKEATSLFEWIEESGAVAFEVRDEKLVPEANEAYSLTLEDCTENLNKYEEIMQGKLRLVYSLIQHSQELALKSHICKESPFLLLVGTDPKSWAVKDVDFTSLKTIDAGDLVKIAMTVTDLKIGETFQTKIEDVRKGRNSIQHLGKHKNIELLEPIRILTRQYPELLPGRNWVQDLEESEDIGLEDIFHYSDTAIGRALHQLSWLHRLTTKKLAKQVLGVDLSSSLYDCPDCIQRGDYDHQGNSVGSIERKRGELHGKCLLCDETFQMTRKKCDECGCDAVFKDHEMEDRCCSCGAEHGEKR